MDFRYAAFTYLYEWVCYDRRSIDVLAFTRTSEPEPEVACQELISVAKHYDIIRNFKLEEETSRLLPAWNALKEIGKPVSPEDAKESVSQLVERLRRPYGLDLWSAASKFCGCGSRVLSLSTTPSLGTGCAGRAVVPEAEGMTVSMTRGKENSPRTKLKF